MRKNLRPRICPRCDGRNIRRSHRKNLAEKARSLFFVRPYRCVDCHYRFWGCWVPWRLSFLTMPLRQHFANPGDDSDLRCAGAEIVQEWTDHAAGAFIRDIGEHADDTQADDEADRAFALIGGDHCDYLAAILISCSAWRSASWVMRSPESIRPISRVRAAGASSSIEAMVRPCSECFSTK